MSFDIPVLLLTWRRPETTKQVIEALRIVAPSHLYVASDGPRSAAEARAVAATRDLITALIDWPCELRTRFSNDNQGCQLGVSSAISWFFEKEEAGIVLEDDCVPHPDFFVYCRELLMRYRDDTRIWCISGDNFQNGAWHGEGSYYFSRYNHCWGWATWRRCWTEYANHVQIWESVQASNAWQQAMFEHSEERSYWMNIWDQLFTRGIPDSWAYRWSLVCMANHGLTALPNQNLVTNVGFGDQATHTIHHLQQGEKKGLGTLMHPSFVYRNSEADEFTYLHHFGGLAIRRDKSVWMRARRFLKSLAICVGVK